MYARNKSSNEFAYMLKLMFRIECGILSGIYTGPKFYPNSGTLFKFSGNMKYLDKIKNAF